MLNNGRIDFKKVSGHRYMPHLGYIGSQELRVPNYLFTSAPGLKGGAVGYAHCRELVELVFSRTVEEQHRRNQALTDFLRKREMTFSKLTKTGEYRIFNVPCTTTPLPLPKSLFNTLERSAQVLVASLRLVLQDIYGSQSVRKSAFVQSLPNDKRLSFINAVEKSPQYFPQLHDPVMKSYPFFDVVGLDLVLTEDLHDGTSPGPRLVSPHLPFRLLEINAGSPSGAANNLHIMEGLAKVDPEVLKKIGKVMPNDHFEVLGQTYKSLGETWTGVQDGIQVILPPGGESGAAPEIHQLATYSGLVYADSGQLYCDSAGYIRLRTVSGDDPVVTAVYSRVNSDSALYDPAQDLYMRDAETGKTMFLTDPIVLGDPFNPKSQRPIRNKKGEFIPLESNYTIPRAIEAIHDRKLYLGGLNRVLDNKIILATLCHYAPRFFKAELQASGIDPDEVLPVMPPQTLPSVMESLDIIEQSPDDWVIKSPNLSGGKGVYILKTLSPGDKRRIMNEARANPKDFAYQKLVRIGRIPVAKKDGTQEFHFANIAADIRMWAFFGAGEKADLPRLTHNGLIRTAPYEKGPLSSIVNTSKGGGYAPLVIIDDTKSANAVSVSQLANRHSPAEHSSDLPAFVGAQLVQVAQLVGGLRARLKESPSLEAYEAYLLCVSLKKQCREILSFLHPTNLESINEMIELLERHVKKTRVKAYFERRAKIKIQLTSGLLKLEGSLPPGFFDMLDNIHALNVEDESVHHLSPQDRAEDRATVSTLKTKLTGVRLWPAEQARLMASLGALVELPFPAKELSTQTRQALLFKLETFCMLANEHLSARKQGRAFSELFAKSTRVARPRFEILFAEATGEKPAFAAIDSLNKALIATEEEARTKRLLIDTGFVAQELRDARSDWLSQIAELGSGRPPQAIEAAREAHFARHPIVAEYQRLIDSPEPSNAQAILRMLEILPYARYNLLQYARNQGISVRELFHDKLIDRRVALLTPEQRIQHGLSSDSFAGECFAHKRQAHGLFSESSVYIWTALELNPFIQAYTVGHELIHFHQIRAMMEREQRALKAGSLEFARFLNFYGNFLGQASGTLEAFSADSALDRRPLYGFTDLLPNAKSGKSWVMEMKHALKQGSGEWNRNVARLGSTLGYSTDISAQIKVKAIREIIPALENAKNISFAKDLGLRFALDATRSALPAANPLQSTRHKDKIDAQVRSPQLDWETLRVIASHQYPGVRFGRNNQTQDALTLNAPLTAVALCGSYNQTQQQ